MPMTFDVENDRPCCCGLWKIQQLVGFLLGIALLVALVAGRPVQTYPQANDMLGLTALCSIFWIFEVVPVYITALFPLIFIPFMEIATSEYIAAAYWNWISMLVVGTYLVDIALEHVHLPRRLALGILLRVGIVRPAALLASFMLMSWLLAMFVNSIAVTLLITPFAISLMNAAEEHARNAAESAASSAEEAGDAGGAEAAEALARVQTDEVQRLADGILLSIAYGASAGGIATITGAIPNYFLAAESVLSGHISWLSWSAYAIPTSVVTLLLAYIVLWARYVRNLRFSGVSREVLEQEYADLLSEIGPFSRDEAFVGMAQVLQIVLLIIRPFTFSKWFTSPFGEEMMNDATLAAIPAVLLFFIPSQVRRGQALLTWPAVHDKLDFGLLLLIGGSVAINEGFMNSGLSIALGDFVARIIPHVHSIVLDLMIMIVVTLSSQVLSSISTANTVLPILASASLQAMVNPLSLMLPATVATSFSFMLPTASPPNVVVLAKSQELPRALRFRDFFTNGLPLTIAAMLLGSLISHCMGVLVFDDHSAMPRWACQAAAGECAWVDVAGLVSGVHVAAQACAVDLGTSDGSLCKLWNGTMISIAEYASPYSV